MAQITIEIAGFENGAREPTQAESSTIPPVVEWINWDTQDYHGLLTWTDLEGVVYVVGNGEQAGQRHEDRFMQVGLVPILEQLAVRAAQENMNVIVTEAWDPPTGSNPHSPGSRHEEGRGIDIVPNYNADYTPEITSKRIGRLAQLAWEIAQDLGLGPNGEYCPHANGCVWVLHEDDHLHLSVRGQTAGNEWGSHCGGDEDCVPHKWHMNQDHYSGAAAAAVILEWQGWWIDIYEFAAIANPSGSLDGIGCEALAREMNRYVDRGWACVRSSSRDEALRIAAYMMAYTSEDNQNNVAFPIVMPMNAEYMGDYRHWVVVDGGLAAEDPRAYGSPQNPGGGAYQVVALSMLDPVIPEGHLYARRSVPRYELEGNLDLDSDAIPNLGLSYHPTGPDGSYELIVPSGCLGATGSLAKASVMSGDFAICSSQYSIVSPYGEEPVTYNREVVVQVLGPADATRAELTVVDSQGYQNVLTEVVPVLSSDESTVWEFHWTPANRSATSYTLSVSADYRGGQMHCGAVTVNSTMKTDRDEPRVDILYPVDKSQIGTSTIIRVLAFDNHFVDEMKVQVTGAETRTLTGYLSCGAGCYEFSWAPGLEGGYVLKAIAKDDERNKGSDQVSVLYGQAPPIHVSLNLSEGQVITKNATIEIEASGGFGDITGSLQIVGPVDRSVEIPEFPFSYNWMPAKNGNYTVKITARDDFSTNYLSIPVSVQLQKMVLGDWVQLSPSNNPGINYGAMVTTGDGLYLFGGVSLSDEKLSNQLWKWDGANWVDLTPSPLPGSWPGVIKHPDMAYDQDRNRIVLLAGGLWEYDLARGVWENKTPNPKPSLWPQSRHRMNTAIYDPQSMKTVFVNIDYTWLWDAGLSTWQRIHTPDINPYNKRDAYQTVALDDRRDVIVLYTTYYNAAGKRYVHTWEWNGSSWDKVARSSQDYTPSGTSRERMFSLSSGVLLVDGYYHFKDPKADFWLWDGVGWTKLQPNSGSPPNTDYPENPIAFDPKNDELVVFTSSGETWVYRFNLNPRMNQPIPYLFTGNHHKTGKTYGPGMRLSWTPTTNPNAVCYEIEFSEDEGQTWHTYNARRPISHGGWINHHGQQECGFGFSYCLKHWHVYSYRVRVLGGHGKPLTDWSNVVSGRSWPWPTHMELSEPDPSGPYMNDETVTTRLINSYGPNLYIDWQIVENGTAHHFVERGCVDGFAWIDPETRYCTISIFKGSTELGGIYKLAAPALAPEESVVIWAKATGNYPSGEVYTDTDYHVLEFKRRSRPDQIQ